MSAIGNGLHADNTLVSENTPHSSIVVQF